MDQLEALEYKLRKLDLFEVIWPYEWIKPPGDEYFHILNDSSEDKTVAKSECGHEFYVGNLDFNSEDNYRCIPPQDRLEGKCRKCLEVIVNKYDEKLMSRVAPELKHLSSEQIYDLLRQYYKGEKASVLIEKFNINVRPSKLYQTFPVRNLFALCLYCSEILQEAFPSVTSKKVNPATCPACGHKEEQNCRCDNCQELALQKRQNELKRKESKIKKHYDLKKYKRKEYSDLSAEEKLYLATVIRASIEQNLDRIAPLKGSINPLTPSNEWNNDLIRTLFRNGDMIVHPTSSTDAFEFDEDGDPTTFYLYDVHYFINIEQGDLDRIKFVDALMNPKDIVDDMEFCYEMWLRIATEECLAYLMHSLNKVNFPFSPGDKTILVIREMLKHFSVAQIYGVIHKQVANSTKFFQEKNITRQHAANSVITGCERFTERAVSLGWELSKYNRIKDLPESVLSLVFFNRVFNIGEDGFNIPPSLSYIEGFVTGGN